MNPNLDELFADVWRRLQEGARTLPPEDPGYRTSFHVPTLVTNSKAGPRGRIVVLRRADLEHGVLTFHTDSRADKIHEMRTDPRIGFTFYDAKWKLQVRASGTATIHHQDHTAQQAWEASDLLSRRCYLGDLAPGTEVTDWDSGLPSHVQDREPTEDEAAPGVENFAVVSCQVEEVEVMRLAFTGHTKARWRREAGEWRGTWLIP